MDTSVFSIMLPASAACLVLVGIHSYLGLHVIKRKVIFVDLALAQIAALGATVGFLFGMDPTSRAAFIFSMAFTFVGAAVFAATRLRKDRVPQEAVIGLVYALAAAITILVIDKSPHGAEHIKDLLTGTILWVKWSQVLTAAVAYAFVGIFHFVLRDKFIRITEDPEGAFKSGMWVRFWDFLFYLSFGFVITFSVRTAGVLLVFVFLVAPAITAAVITNKWRYQLLIGWGMGTLVTIVALYLSYVLDLPSGPTVVAFYGVVLLVVSLIVYVVRTPDRRHAWSRLGLGLGVTALGIGALWGMGTLLGSSAWAEDDVHHQLAKGHGHAAPQPAESTAKPEDLPDDPEQRVALLGKHVADHTPGWRTELVEAVLDPDMPLLFKEDALALLRKEATTDFDYDSEAEDNAAAAEKMRQWASETP
ncbi:MAG: hypothetical protein DRI90_02805 [Deltaproteobacteria bacterium]|nr:MAG: hypothetical protein DRI90_02805 [Deltaproteobacteria bacterium]